MEAFELGFFEETDQATGFPTIKVDFKVGRGDGPLSAEHNASWTTVLIGRNGGGKSRTLRAVTSLLLGMHENRFRPVRPGVTWRLGYSVGKNHYMLEAGPRRAITVMKNGSAVKVEDAQLPSKVIAASAAANDKFPIPRRFEVSDDWYYYFGLRDATGRASGVAPLLSALEALSAAEAGDTRRIQAVATVFEMLGYSAVFTHRYRMGYFTRLGEAESVSSLYENGLFGSYIRNRIDILLRQDPEILEKLDFAFSLTKTGRIDGPFVEIEADFSNGGLGIRSNAKIEFESINLLRRAGILRLQSVNVQKLDDGTSLDLREASSGQISLATTFLGIAASISDGALVLIDEPEISLHPEWQSAYLGLAQRLFSSYVGCHFLVATHSPSVVAGMSERNANTVSLDQQVDQLNEDSNYGGESVDELLVKEFGVYERGNLFLQKELTRALELASVGEIDSDAFKKIAEVISPAATELIDDPIGILVASLLRAAEEANRHEEESA